VHDEAIAAARGKLGARLFKRAWEAGLAMRIEEAVEHALAEAPPAAVDAAPGLTPRELQVASLVAQGRSSREIAEALVISERTAESHVEHIRAKLGVHSRAEIAAWATARGLQGDPATRPG
jgi:DNA-binding CsgD family transcriptional regulator